MTLIASEKYLSKDEIELVENIENLERLGMGRTEIKHAAFYYDEENQRIVLFKWIFGSSLDDYVVYDVKTVSLSHEPIDLTGEIEEYTDFITEDILPRIETFGYPDAHQQKFLDNMSENPSDPATIAYLRSCNNSKCLCPLFFSLSCVEFHTESIEKTGKDLSFTPQEGMRKRPIKRIVTSLRQELSSDELQRALGKIKNRKDREDVLLGSYKGGK